MTDTVTTQEYASAPVVATVLICDDEEPLRALVRASLGEARHEFFEASDGDESLELARRVHPDVIILDVMMPGRSGLDVLRTLRADPELAAIPVLVLTARAQRVDHAAAIRAGADCYLTKPFSPLELAASVAELLERRA